MNARLRNKWLDLLASEGGRSLAARYEALPAEIAEALFTLAEELDARARRVALSYLSLTADWSGANDAAARERLAAWAAKAHEAASAEIACCVLDVGRNLKSFSEDEAERWLEMGLALAARSERAARAYFTGTPLLLDRSADLDPQVWGSAALPLLEAGWQVQQLAADFLTKTAPLASALGPEMLGVVAESAAQIARRHGPLAAAWLSEGPGLLAEVAPAARRAVGELATVASRGAAAGFADLIRRAVALSRGLPLEHAEPVLRVAAALFPDDPERVIELLRRAPEVLGTRAVSRWTEGRSAALEAAQRIAKEDAHSAANLILALPDLRRLAGPDEVRTWAEEGLRLLNDPLKARAYFSLASRASRAQLAAYNEGIRFAEITRPMALFAQGLCGRHIPVAVVDPDEAGSLAERPLPATDGVKIFLPELTWGFGEREENRRAARVMAAHQAGHFEWETFSFDARKLARKRSAIVDLSRFEPPAGKRGDLQWFFSRFAFAPLAKDLFTTLESYRIDSALMRLYAGLAPDIRWLWRAELAGRPPPDGAYARGGPLGLLVELLIRRSLGAEEPADLGRDATSDPQTPELTLAQLELGQLWDDLGAFVESLARPDAAVEDSAVRAAELYHLASLFTGAGARPRLDANDWDETSESREVLPQGEIPQGVADEYAGAEPVSYRGETDPAAAQQKMAAAEALDLLDRAAPTLEQMAPQDVEAMLALLPEFDEDLIREADLGGQGQAAAYQEETGTGERREGSEGPAFDPAALEGLRRRLARRLGRDEDDPAEERYLYDEWDHTIGDYRSSWCTVRERLAPEEDPSSMEQVLAESAQVVRDVIAQFERIRPEVLRRERAQLEGEEIDLDRVIEAKADRRMGSPWPERLYERRAKAEREVAALFLIDMSASTGERIPDEEEEGPEAENTAQQTDYWWEKPPSAKSALQQPPQAPSILDIEREALLVMSHALSYLGDRFAAYGFSGHGREQVELYRIKDFTEHHSRRMLRRIAGIRPRQSTRMGAAVRHAAWHLSHVEARYKALILISDGYPQDTDYGTDRRDETYALLDTRAALSEAEQAGIHPFCVTVDKAGYDYLRKMSPDENYVVIEHVRDLPSVLPQIYRKLTR